MPSEDTPPQSSAQTRLDVFERVTKILAIVAIPVVIPLALAFYSARVQEGAQKESINRDYVQLAVSILKEKRDDVNPSLRDWATDLLTEHSPTKFAPNVIQGLKSGALSFPGLLANETGRIISAISSDGKLVATSDGRGIAVWDIAGGQNKFIRDLVSPVNALEFSPDGAVLAIGFSDGVVSLVSALSLDKRTTFKIEEPVSGIKIVPSGQIYVMTYRGNFYVYDNNGALVLLKRFGPHTPQDFRAIVK
jgi:WD40 repeat protein